MMNERDLLNECRRLDREDRHVDAVELLSQAIADTPSDQLFYQRGVYYERLGEYAKAFDDFSTAARLEPNKMSYLVSKGVLLCSCLGRPADALDEFSRALSANPGSPSPHQHLCLCYLQLGDSDAACDHAERAIDLDDSDAYSHYCLGQCRLAAERFHSAAEQFEMALQIDPRSARFWAGLCDASVGTGDLDKARECCEKAIDLDPRANSYIHLAAIQLDTANPQGAIESLNSASEFELNEVQRMLVDGYLKIATQRR